jgi:hypothetical protein
MAPRVSVIMPVYNGARFVGEAIDSILNQTLKDFELLVVDDASTDDTPIILSQYAAKDSRVLVDRLAANSGAIGARNYAIAKAKSDVIANMDADDVSLPDRLSKQFEYLSRHLEVGAVGSSVRLIDENGVSGAVKSYPSSPTLTSWSLLFFNSLAHPTVMMRREALQAVGGYEEASRGTWVEDYSLFTRMSRQFGLANIAEVLLHYRQTSTNTTSKYWTTQEMEANRLVQTSVLALTGEDLGEEDAAALRGLSTGRYPSSAPTMTRLSATIGALCRRFIEREALSGSQKREVEGDAAVKQFLLGALALRVRPTAALKIFGEAVRVHPAAPLLFAQKAWTKVRR